MASSFSLRRATQHDVEALCDVYLSAFRDEIFSRQVFPRDGSSTGREYWRRAFAEELREPDATFLVAVERCRGGGDDESKRGNDVERAAPEDEAVDGYPPDGLPDVAALYYKRLFEGHRRCVGDMPHWYLDMVGVRQEAMGKGAARQLMEWGLERAGREGFPCFVESTGDAQAFYERFGFREVDKMSVDTPQGEAVVVFMLMGVASND
ncbi:hypothetical protein ACCO45_007784 [Purpureocillium lilacinum]|uniref:Uncharacterized protein n=1 Tax=Purpureocillium lilacinum TaxID=33203 RepID=A0ACC4DP46_PURLI